VKHISSKSPTCTVYKCEQGGLHLVIRDANISLSESEFYSANEQIQQASRMIDNSTWPGQYVKLSFCKVSLVVDKDDLSIIAKVTKRAKEVMERRKRDEKSVDINKANKGNTLPIVDKKDFKEFLN